MEKKIKDIIGTDPEDLFDSITSDFTEIVKYAALLDSGNYFRESYLKDINELYTRLIRYCRFFLPNLYRKEIENIFSEEVETLPEIKEEVDTIKTVETTRTWRADNNEKTENL